MIQAYCSLLRSPRSSPAALLPQTTLKLTEVITSPERTETLKGIVEEL